MNSATVTSPPATKPRRWLRILKRTVITIAIIFVVLIYVVFPILFSRLITGAGTRPLDRRLTATPADYGAEYKDVEFQTSDGVKISGWLLPSRGKQCTI